MSPPFQAVLALVVSSGLLTHSAATCGEPSRGRIYLDHSSTPPDVTIGREDGSDTKEEEMTYT
jgi:hypothetical protein